MLPETTLIAFVGLIDNNGPTKDAAVVGNVEFSLNANPPAIPKFIPFVAKSPEAAF